MPAFPAFDSLRLRLIAIPAAALTFGLLLTVAFTLADARDRIDRETDSGLRLGGILAQAVLRDVRPNPDRLAALDALRAGLQGVRHVALLVLPDPDLLALGATPSTLEDRDHVPAWFARLFLPTPRLAAFPVAAGGRSAGTLLMLANPLDEIGEIWEELRFIAVLMVSQAAVVIGLIIWTVRRSLLPLLALADGFDRLERGEFGVRLGRVPVAELRRVGAQFDHLAESLQSVTDDNRRLIDRLLSLQDAERREIAHELHDEFGPSLFGIRAELAALTRALRTSTTGTDEAGLRHAASIGTLVDGIQRINARMLDQLRPVLLDQLGLAEALRHLVAGWRERAPSIAFSLSLPAETPALGQSEALALYRTAQEAVTNAVRHARAGHVDLCLSRAREAVSIAIRDDGVGFRPGLRRGFGLLGMTERVRAAGGALSIEPGRAGGTCVRATLPAKGRAAA